MAGMGLLSNKIGREELKPGDHIYVWRHVYLYTHHGIYVGNGNVIHFTCGAWAGQEMGAQTMLKRFFSSSAPYNPPDSPCPKCGDQTNTDGVILSCLECFLSGGELHLFQYGVSPAFFVADVRGGTCTLARSDSPEDALHRANCLLQSGFGGYDLFKNNCETFAVYCKTGLFSVGQSGQATGFQAAATAIASSRLRFMPTGFIGLTVMNLGIHSYTRIVNDIGFGGNRDVMKIPVEELVRNDASR